MIVKDGCGQGLNSDECGGRPYGPTTGEEKKFPAH